MEIPPGISVMPFFEGRLPRTMFLASDSHTMSCWISVAPPIIDVVFFSMKSEAYLLVAGITNGRLFLERNGQVASLRLAASTNENSKTVPLDAPCFVGVSWSPTLLRVWVNDTVESISTSPTLPPNSLLDWARRQAIIPSTTYASDRAFADVVLNGLSGLDDKIKSSRMEYAFWDFDYDGAKIVRRCPKKETQIHPTVHGLLHDLAIAKNLQIYPEAASGAGRLDFLITAILDNGATAKACIEFKNAHSTDVAHGLLQQLPQYMRTHGTEIGFYCVPWFRGRYFDLPVEDSGQFRSSLVTDKMHAGLEDICLVIIDVSGGSPPSTIKPQ